jgi:RNA-directed DNA polymerase
MDFSQSRTDVLYKIGRKLFGWQKAYSFCTNSQEFIRVDQNIHRKIHDYEQWIRRRSERLSVDKLMPIVGIPSVQRLFEKDKAAK